MDEKLLCCIPTKLMSYLWSWFFLWVMGSGDKNHHHHPHLNFHIHMPHLHFHHHNHDHGHVWGKKEVLRDIPKGCLAIMVGCEGEEQQRFIIPVIYINHPLFMPLLKEAEEEYGFDHQGPLNIPCHVEEFRHVQGIIDRDNHAHTDAHAGTPHSSWCSKA